MASVATLRDLTEALIQSAKDEGKLEKVTADLEAFFKINHDQEQVKNILASPVYDMVEKKAIADDIGERTGFDKLTINFIALVIELGKFKALLKSEEPFLSKLRKASGKVRAEVTTASNPSESDLNRIKGALKELTKKDVEVIIKIDPSIIGGIIAKVEDKVFDGSIKNQLERIRNILSVT
jgi:F-type H+-transporting ATPase subunit delta